MRIKSFPSSFLIIILFLFYCFSFNDESLASNILIKHNDNADFIDIYYSFCEDSASFYINTDGYQLPQHAFAVAVPPAKSYYIEHISHMIGSIDNKFRHFPPDPDEFLSKPVSDIRISIDPLLENIVISKTGILRFQHIVTFNIRPVIFSERDTELYDSLHMRLHFKDIDHDIIRPSFILDEFSIHWEDSLKTLLVNYEQGRSWRLKQDKNNHKSIDLPSNIKNSSSPIIKFTISRENIYIIKPKLFFSLNIDTSTIDPRTFQLFYKGVEIPIIVHGAADGIFDNHDYILFYGKGADRNGYHRNIHSEESHYFLIYNQQPGLRFTMHNSHTTNTPNTSSFSTSTLFEENHLHDIYHLYDTDPLADNFFWKRVDAPSIKIFPFITNNVAPVVQDSVFSIYLTGVTSLDVSPDHHFIVKLNDIEIVEDFFDGRTSHLFTANFPSSLLNDGLNYLSLQTLGTSSPNQIDSVYLNWFKLDYNSYFRMDNDVLSFTRPKLFSLPSYIFKIDNINHPHVIIWDIANGIEFTDFTVWFNEGNNSYSLLFEDNIDYSASKGDRPRYFATTRKLIKSPDKARVIEIPDIFSTYNSADLLIIYHDKFREPAEILASFYESAGHEIFTISIDDIYNVFNHGDICIYPIRDFLSHVYNSWEKVPSHVTLFGGTTYDPMFFLEDSTKNLYIPAWGEPANDFFYASVSEGDIFLDYYLSRIPVQTLSQAYDYIQKIMKYTNNPFSGEWEKRTLFINGGMNSSEQTIFAYQTDKLLEDFVCPNMSKDSEFICNSLIISKTTTGCNWGEYNDEIHDAFTDGISIVNFFGHAGSMTWDCMYYTTDVMTLTNLPRLPVIFSNTCFTAAFDNSSIYSLSELFTTYHGEGGAVAFVGQPLLAYMWGNYYFSREYFRAFYEHKESNIGKAVAQARIQFLISYPEYTGLYYMMNLIGDGFADIRLRFE